MERPNLGKSRVLVERENLLYTEAAFAPRISYPLVTSVVTIPRQLAPTVGPWPKGVYIMGEALLGMGKIAIGEIIIDLRSGSDQMEVSKFIPFGQINAFVGMVNASGSCTEESKYESLSGTATITRSDEEESVGTSEIDLSKTLLEDDSAWVLRRVTGENEETHEELCQGCYGYEAEEEHEQLPGPIRWVGVYTTPAINHEPTSIPTAVVATADALAQIQQNQPNQQSQLMIRNPPQPRVDGEIASVSLESEATARNMNQFGFLLNRPSGEGTSANPPNPVFPNHNPVLDPITIEAETTPENAIIRVRELETIRRTLEQQKKEIEVEKERVMARQRLLDERESRLFHSNNVVEECRNNPIRAYQGRHQSRFPLLGETLNPTALFATPNDQLARFTQGTQAAREGNVTGSVRLPTGRTRGNMGGGHSHSPRFHSTLR